MKKIIKIGLINILAVAIAVSVWLIRYHTRKSMDAVFQAKILGVGDVIEIFYNGEIMETYPARLQNVSGIRIVSETKLEKVYEKH